MSGTPVHGHQGDYVGILQEPTYKTNPVADFSVAETYCNPLFTSETDGPNAGINNPSEGVVKTLNTRDLAELTDNVNGRKDYTLTMGGSLKNGGLGYVLQCFNQAVTFSTDMIYQLEVTDKTCKQNSYHIYVPRQCNTARTAMILGGCVPQVLTIDFKAQTWNATFNCATKNESPAANEIPSDVNYRDIATIDKSNYDLDFGQLVIDGDTQETTTLTLTITYLIADIAGHYGADGKRTGFLNNLVSTEIGFSLPYSDTIETDNKSKTYWLGADGEPQIGSFGITSTSDVNNSINVDCWGSMMGIVRETPGDSFWAFTGTITVQQDKIDSAKDYKIIHKDDLDDITANF